MRSKKLTNPTRQDIVMAVANKTFEDRNINLQKTESILYSEILDEIIPNDFKEFIKNDTIKIEWVPKITSIDIRDGSSFLFSLSGEPTPSPFELYNRGYSVRIDINKLSKVIRDKIKVYTNSVKKQKEDIKKLKLNIQKIVNSCNTFKQLNEIWPDVSKYYVLDDTTPNLPAVMDPAKINKMITDFQKDK